MLHNADNVCAGKEVEETLRIVDAQSKEAAAKKQVVEGEEAIASEKAAAAKAIKVRWHCCTAWQHQAGHVKYSRMLQTCPCTWHNTA